MKNYYELTNKEINKLKQEFVKETAFGKRMTKTVMALSGIIGVLLLVFLASLFTMDEQSAESIEGFMAWCITVSMALLMILAITYLITTIAYYRWVIINKKIKM